MSVLSRSAASVGQVPVVVFDQAHLKQYTMDNPQLEREIIELFLMQLPDVLAHLDDAADGKEWRLWAHTLKGSAVAVGAARIHALAVDLEKTGFQSPPEARRARLVELRKVADEFSALAARLYPARA